MSQKFPYPPLSVNQMASMDAEYEPSHQQDPSVEGLAEAIEYFKRVNPHAAKDEYFLSPEKSQTIAAYLAGRAALQSQLLKAEAKLKASEERAGRLEAKVKLAQELVKIIDIEGPAILAWERASELCKALALDAKQGDINEKGN